LERGRFATRRRGGRIHPIQQLSGSHSIQQHSEIYSVQHHSKRKNEFSTTAEANTTEATSAGISRIHVYSKEAYSSFKFN